MDLTSGFYQMPMEEASKEYTAFATDIGLYEFNVASMGLLNSPWYFQNIMENEVLPHLVHKIVEIYIDDLLCWAQSVDELIDRLQKVFDALNKKGLKLNPKKCDFGLTEVEFVGHLIDNSGITFTSDKLKLVAEMALPMTKGELKTFLGMAGYFRNHIPDYVDKTETLNNKVGPSYEKKHSKQLLEWTEEEKIKFADCQKAVIGCRKLYYEVDGAPIRVYTDASEYGIGAYLCQVLPDGSEIPIEFISKTLTKAERKWSTFEKEAFAIFYALRKWEAHLRDVKFTLFTDHKNLTYISKDHNAKVMRWRLAGQDYDFDIAYIPGEKNIIADGFSRMCPTSDIETDEAIAKASADMNALRTNISYFDEWPQIKKWGEEKDHTSYRMSEDDDEDIFFELQTKTSYLNAMTSRVTLRKKEFTFLPIHVKKIIEKCHNHHIGHWGVNRTIELVNKMIENDPEYEKLVWNGMRKDIQSFINNCDCCNKMTEKKMSSHIQKYTTSEYGIMQCISVDAIHMPNKTKNGNKYILTVIDAFTRYVALYAVKDLSAQTAAKNLINHFCVYGIPEKITTDNSTEFDEVFSETLEILKIEKYRTHAYSHQENSIVERANKEVVRHIRNIVYELRKNDSWDDELLKVQAMMNEKTSEATGLSPNQIIFAGQIDLHAGRLYPQPTIKQHQSMSSYMKKQIEFQDNLMKLAEKEIMENDKNHLENNVDLEIKYDIGDYIVVRHESGEAPNKLSVRWHGPYRITEVENRPQGTIYTTYSPKDGKIAYYHASFVKQHPCRDDLEAVKSAVLDDDKEVLDHEIITNNNKQTLNLKIKWFGYKEPEMTGLNISLKRNKIIKNYLKDKNLEKFGTLKRDDRGYENPNEKETIIKKTRFLLNSNE